MDNLRAHKFLRYIMDAKNKYCEWSPTEEEFATLMPRRANSHETSYETLNKKKTIYDANHRVFYSYNAIIVRISLYGPGRCYHFAHAPFFRVYLGAFWTSGTTVGRGGENGKLLKSCCSLGVNDISCPPRIDDDLTPWGQRLVAGRSAFTVPRDS